MFPDTWLDIGIAVGLLALFVIVGTVFQVFDFDLFESEEERKIKELGIYDASELFLLSYIKTNTDSGRINDLIRDSEDDDEKFLDLERETDTYALNALIPEKFWANSLARFSKSIESVLQESKTLNIHSAIIAGRIRNERQNYFILNELIGNGEVRHQFEETRKV